MFTQAELEPYRQDFPHLSRPHYYLNHASFGVLATSVNAEIQKHLNARNSGKIETYMDDMPIVESAREKAARLINAPSPDDISFVMNTSDGISIVAAGIPWKAGDRILLNDAEFPSNVYPYLNLRRLGVHVDFIPNTDGYVSAEAIAAAIRPETRLIALSAVQFLSGYRADLRRVGQIARAHNSLFVVDAIQAAGNSPLDVQAMHIDALVTGGLKWLMAPMGIGFVYTSHTLRQSMHPAHTGWLSVAEPWQLSNFDQELHPSGRRFENGGLNIPGIYALNRSLDAFLDLGTECIREHLIALTDQIDVRMQEIDLSRFTIADPEFRTGIISYNLPEYLDGDRLISMLSEKGVTISHRQGKIRFSPHYYNSMDDIDNAMDIFSAVYQTFAASHP
jgi:cysteine desulfurase / selenocysteine lyase